MPRAGLSSSLPGSGCRDGHIQDMELLCDLMEASGPARCPRLPAPGPAAPEALPGDVLQMGLSGGHLPISKMGQEQRGLGWACP